jgi:hypothetical protein
MQGGNYAQKYHIYSPDCTDPHFCGSKHPGGGIPVPGLDNFHLQSANAIRDPGHRCSGRVDFKVSESQAGKENQSLSFRTESASILSSLDPAPYEWEPFGRTALSRYWKMKDGNFSTD